MRHKFLVLPVKKWLKSVHIYGSYRKNKTGVPFFLEHPVCHGSDCLPPYCWLHNQQCPKHWRYAWVGMTSNQNHCSALEKSPNRYYEHNVQTSQSTSVTTDKTDFLQDAVLSQGEPCDAAVIFDTHRSLQQHPPVFTLIVLLKNLALLSTFGIRITCTSHFHAVIVGNVLQLLRATGRPLRVCAGGRAARHGASGQNTA